MTLGKKIEICRKKNDMSIDDLSSLLNISKEEVQKMEKGLLVPKKELIEQMSRVFDVKKEWLVEKENTTIKTNSSNNSVIKEEFNKEASITNNKSTTLYTVIKVFMIIGMAISPLSFSLTMVDALYDPTGFYFLFLYFLVIPFGLLTLHITKYAEKKSKVIFLGILSIILVSVVGGILILSIPSNQLPFYKKVEKIQEGKPIKVKENSKLNVESMNTSMQSNNIKSTDKNLDSQDNFGKLMLFLSCFLFGILVIATFIIAFAIANF